MMTEKKRFEFYSDEYLVGIIDTASGKKLNHFATIDLLNEQQEMIDQLEKENKQLRKTIALFEVEEDEINFLKEVVVVDE